MLFDLSCDEVVDKQGYNANISGQNFEQIVEDIMIERGAVIAHGSIQSVDIFDDVVDDTVGVLYKNVPYTSMYGLKCIGEFALHIRPLDLYFRIECRNQTVGGSVDEKAAYLLGNCVHFEEKNVILVIDGGGMRGKIREWVINEAYNITTTTTTNVTVTDIDEFEKLMDSLLCKESYCTLEAS